MSEYWTSSGITVYDFDKCILALKKRHEDQLDRIKYLEEENRKLKDAAYKDAEMAKMKSQFDEMKKDYYRGFPITESENQKIKEWMKEHDVEAHGYFHLIKHRQFQQLIILTDITMPIVRIMVLESVLSQLSIL